MKTLLKIVLVLLYLASPLGLIAIFFLLGPGVAFGTIFSLVNYIKSLKIVYANSEYDITKLLYKIQFVGTIVGMVMVVVIAAFSVISIFYEGGMAEMDDSIWGAICRSGLCETRFFQFVHKYVMMVFEGIFDFYRFVIYAPILGPEVTSGWKLY